MPERPRSVTIISWIVILGTILGGGYGIAVEVGWLDSARISGTQAIVQALGLAPSIVAAVAMLKGISWGRSLYIASVPFYVIVSSWWGGITFIPGLPFYVVFVFFLLRPKAVAYFKGGSAAAGVPHEAGETTAIDT